MRVNWARGLRFRGPRVASPSTESTSQGRVVGIMHSQAGVSAMVGSILVHEGDMVGDVRVVKIEKDKIHFEKLGIEWSQTVQDPPSKHWK